MIQKQTIATLKKQNDKLRFDNLRMRMHLEILSKNIDSLAAKKILAIYRRKILAREERYLESQN